MDRKSNHHKEAQWRRKLRDRADELTHRVETCSSDALEHVLHVRMDTYFEQEERLEEMTQLLKHLPREIDQTEDLQHLKRIADRLTFLEGHFEEIDGAMHDRPPRPSKNRFNFSNFFRQWHADRSDGCKEEISNEEEAYQELNLETRSSFKEVKAAFRRLIKDLHPDRHNGDRSTEPKMRRLVAAYEFIKKNK